MHESSQWCHTVKGLLGRSLFASGFDALLLRDRAVVVAFHRVHDDAGASDSLTVGVRTFERYCRYFKRRFRVVPLRDLVDRLAEGRLVGRELAITFDDGYRDNFENAAPVLERLSLPATFFVVTQWMGTDVVPFWDERRGVRHPWMTWAEVRSLHRRGFEIGVHTRTHVDLGTLSGGQAADEIPGARRELEWQLGARGDVVCLSVRSARKLHGGEPGAGPGSGLSLLLLRIRRHQHPRHGSVPPAAHPDFGVLRVAPPVRLRSGVRENDSS